VFSRFSLRVLIFFGLFCVIRLSLIVKTVTRDTCYLAIIYIYTHTRRAETCIGLEKMLGALENESDAYAEAIKTHYSEYLYTLWSWRYGCEKGVVVESGARPR
jgi:hypothetical protein